MVGEVISAQYEDMDGLFIVLDAMTGETKAWKRVGGVGNQIFNDVVQNLDGTFTTIGSTQREGRAKVGWITKLDIHGEMLDLKELSMNESSLHHLAVNEDGVMMAAGSHNLSKKVTVPILVSISQSLDIAKIQPSIPLPTKIESIATSQRGFMLLGNTSIRDKNHPGQIWCRLIDAQGNTTTQGERYFGERGRYEAYDIKSTSDGGWIITGTALASSQGKADMLLIKTSTDGEKIWEKTYGGAAPDIAAAVIELSIGGYAILGHTWSHMPIARFSNIQLVVTDDKGVQIDDDIIPIRDAQGDQYGFSLCESHASRDLVVVGNDIADERKKRTFLSSISYFTPELSTTQQEDGETFGASSEGVLNISPSRFYDANQNHVLEQSERGYVEVNVSNISNSAQGDVVVNVTSGADLTFWKTVYLGNLKADETKKLRIPVLASDKPQKGNYSLDLSISAAGKFVASGTAQLATNQPNPADLIVNKYHFTPNDKPAPGQPIMLKIEIANNGGSVSDALMADFDLPSGVEARASQRIKLPVLQPHDKHTLSFSFTYSDDFDEDNIRIAMATNSTKNVVGIKRSFDLRVNQKQEVVRAPASNDDGSTDHEIFWVSHDIDEYRTVEVSKNSVDLRVIALSKDPLSKQNFAVMINGRRSQGQKLDEAQLKPSKASSAGRMQHSYTNTVRLSEGINEVQIVYFAADGKTIVGKSAPVSFHYIPKDKPNLYVLSIGVAHDDLAYTVNDAKAFANMYARLRDDRGRGFKKVEVIQLLTEAETTENNIKKAFINLSKDRRIKDNDLVVVFLSSHGKVIDADRYVLLPSDYDPRYESLSTIDFNDDILKQLRTVDGNKLVFIDACHSGSAGSRSFSDDAASKVMNDLIKATSGMEIFASCGDKEYSYEDKIWGNGAFTKAIIEAFNNETVDMNGKKISADIYTAKNGQKSQGSDGVITIEELKSFVQQRVPFLVKHTKNKPQNPTNKSTHLLPEEMGIYMVGAE